MFIYFPFLLVTLCVGQELPRLKVTFPQLLQEVSDLQGLVRWPNPPFATRQFSSRDRLSENPRHAETWYAGQDRGHSLYDGTVSEETPFFTELPGLGRQPEGTFAKGTRIGLALRRSQGEYVWAYATAPDGGPVKGKIPQGFIPRRSIRLNEDGHVLAEMNGPGCLVRFWSANPSEGGTVRVYLDDAAEPILTARLQDLLGGTWEKELAGQRVIPFPKPLTGERGQGWTMVFPLPYQKKCKVVVEKPELAYHIGYRTYPAGTKVETFTWELWAKHQAEVQMLADHLSRRVRGAASVSSSDILPAPQNENPLREIALEPGATVTLRSFVGTGCIEGLEFRLTSGQAAEALRGLVLRIVFDDAPTPQVHCPLGDFCGTSPGANPYQAVPLNMSADSTLTSHWRMPFARKAVVSLSNHSRQRVQLTCDALVQGYDWRGDSLHFHAKWQQQLLPTRPFRDWNVCHLHGQGVYVGTMLSVMNPVSAWWGEGDDKMYIDGESFPSLFGTATDEHFGYAFGHRQPFHHPFHNLTRCDGPGHHAYASMNRFLLLDRVPFTKGFRFDLELRHWTPGVSVAYAVTCYWYARPGATDQFPALQPGHVQTLPTPPPVRRLAGAWEGEQLRVLEQSTNFAVGPQEIVSAEGAWSNGSQLFAQPTKKGEWVDLVVPVIQRGKQELLLHLAQGPQNGLLRFQVNGKAVHPSHDGYQAGAPRLAPPLSLGIFDLEPGTLTLRIESAGADAQALFPRYAWGLDAVVLQPVK